MGNCNSFFITGTDTGIGKTYTTITLMRKLAASGKRVAGMKPIASGASMISGALKNEDALLIQAECSMRHDYDMINPFTMALPISPNIAADIEQLDINLDVISSRAQALQKEVDFLFVEGIGGWRVPWSDSLQARDLVQDLNIPVLLTVGLYLGGINHALLTAEALEADAVSVAGWVANQIRPDYEKEEASIEYLEKSLPWPCLGRLDHQPGQLEFNQGDVLDISSLMADQS